MMIFFIVAFVLFFSSCGKEDNDKIGSIQTRLDQIEERQLKYEEIANKTDQLEILFKRLEDDSANLKNEVEAISKQVGILQKAYSTITEKPKASVTVQKKKTSKVKGNYYEVQEGDTLYGIANKYGLSVEELYSMNNISKGQIIHPGQKILIK